MNQQTERKRRALDWAGPVVTIAITLIAGVVVYWSNGWLSQGFTETTRNKAELRSALYVNAILSELKRHQTVPLLLARDPFMISALSSQDFTNTSQRLISFANEIGSNGLRLLDADGRVVASSDRAELGKNLRDEPFFLNAYRTNETVFAVNEDDNATISFTYSCRIEFDKQGLGVLVVDVDLKQYETRWRSANEAIFVADSNGRIIIATDGRWRGKTVEEALAKTAPATALQKAFETTGGYLDLTWADTYYAGTAVMRTDTRIPFRGWRMTTFNNYASVRERVNGVLAIEIMIFAMLLAFAFYLLSRRARSEAGTLRIESEQLRELNSRLQCEIAERKKVERTLEDAEQSLAQSQKLAALGEMSAAVSHELNQPLAAMKTYLAGAKLLLQRKRMEEAQSSFQRIDALIERMGAITRQLKSYARKGEDELRPVDLRKAVSEALSLMEPQIKRHDVTLQATMPEHPVLVLGDQLRIEQVIINLLRNAIDATKNREMPRIDMLLVEGETATLTVRDNGEGLHDPEALFEPFYTTKMPGEGVGLGLAISSGIISDLGGTLTARNARSGGAVFQVQLPRLSDGQRTGGGTGDDPSEIAAQ